MARSTQWLSSITMGTLLAWQALPANAQRFSNTYEPTPSNISGTDAEDDEQNTTSEGRTADDDDSQSGGESSTDEQGHRHDSDSEQSGTLTPEKQGDTEIIKERYPDGSVRIEREVTQDSQGNYVNHGMWKEFDQRGALTAQGEYRHGERVGEWVKWYRSVTDAKMLSSMPYQQFVGPFISQATFKDGQLSGSWTIYDGKKHKISQWEFTDGKRHGSSIWWFANGRKMREIEFRDGDLDGSVTEWGAEGSVLTKDTYQAGRKLAEKTSKYPGGNKKSKGMYLFAREVEQTPDDWWTCKVRTTTKTGKDEKHGAWTSWHSNGQQQLEGTYEHDLQTGQFSWWHSNGQKALEGRFEAGKQDGEWTWWYASGQKSIHGEYAHGNPTGRWTWWKEDGKVAQSADLSHSEGVVIETPRTIEPTTPPHAQAAKPKAPTQKKR